MTKVTGEGPTVGVFGATGQVGTVMRSVLATRQFPVGRIRFFGSTRSVGRTLPWAGADVAVEDSGAPETDFEGIDIALFSNGAVNSRPQAPRVAATGAIVIDNSSAWRMHPDVPLVVTEVNADALASIPKGIVANPNCTTMLGMPVLAALHRAAGLPFVEVFVDASLALCERRDPKGLYARARAGQLADLTGVGAPYEPPRHPDLVLGQGVKTADRDVEQVLALLTARGLTSGGPADAYAPEAISSS